MPIVNPSTFAPADNTLLGLLAASSGSSLAGFIQSGTGAVARTVQDELRELWFNVKDFGAVGDGTTDDSTNIQKAITAAQVAGGIVYFPLGAYSLGTAGITNTTGNGVFLRGQIPRFVGATLFGVELLYSGTGVAVITGQSGALNYRNCLDNIQIRATGPAITSATAVGLRLINTQYFSSDKSAIKDFTSGIGLQFKPAGALMYGASNVFKELFVHLCNIGVQSVGTDAVVKDNATIFFGGGVLNNAAPAGSIGYDLQQYSDSYVFYGTDCEGCETAWKIDGSNHEGFGARSEDCTTHISFTTNAATCHFVRHINEGSGTAITDTSTLHSSTAQFAAGGIYRGKLNLQPLSDTTEVVSFAKADGAVLVDFSTTGTPRVDFSSGVDLNGYSGVFTSQKWKITGATGLLTVGDGTSGAPSLAFTSIPSTGALLDNSQFTITNAGSRIVGVGTTANGLVIRNDSPLSWGASVTVNPDTFIFRDAANVVAQKNGNLAQEYRVYAGNGGFISNVKTVTESLTIAAAATTVSATTIPAGAILLAVSARVTTVIPTAATFTVTTTTGGTTLNTAAVSTAANSTDAGTAAGASYRAASTTVTITPNLTPGAATGVVRLQYYYLQVTPATS